MLMGRCTVSTCNCRESAIPAYRTCGEWYYRLCEIFQPETTYNNKSQCNLAKGDMYKKIYHICQVTARFAKLVLHFGPPFWRKGVSDGTIRKSDSG